MDSDNDKQIKTYLRYVRFLREPSILLATIGVFVIVGGLLWHSLHLSNKLSADSVVGEASRKTQLIKAFRSLYTSEVVSRVKPHGVEVRHDYASHKNAIPLPVTLTNLLSEKIRDPNAGEQIRLYSDYPFPSKQKTVPLDEFERDALQQLRLNSEQSFYRFEQVDGRSFLRYATADIMQPSCVFCHNTHPNSPKRDWKVGDVRGVLAISIPVQDALSQTTAVMRESFIVLIVLSSMGLLGLIFIATRTRLAFENLRKLNSDQLANLNENTDPAEGMTRTRYFAGNLLVISLLLTFDLKMPLGVAGGVPYIVLVLFSLWQSRPIYTCVAAVVGTALTLLGFWLSQSEAVAWIVLTNRLLALFAIWVTAILCLWQKRKNQEQIRAVAELKVMAERQTQESRHRSILENVNDAIVSINEEGIIEQFNHAAVAMFGYSPDEVLGENILSLIPSLCQDEEYECVGDCLRSGSVQNFGVCREHFGTRKNGVMFSIHLSLSEVALTSDDESNRSSVFIGIIHDTTQQKKMEAERVRAREAAEASSLAKSEFLANMSHEIRTPMTAILGFTDILRDNLHDADNVEITDTIKQNGDYLLNIINDILDLSKIESGKLDVERIACSPRSILTDVISLMDVPAALKTIPLDLEYVGPIPKTILSDPTRLRQVLINLIGNAIKFTEVGSVRVVARLLNEPGTEPKLQVDVIDTGIGIAANQIEKLFEPFVQADNSTTRNFGGTGLGLTISKRLIEVLGGDISIDSTPGTGSIFSVTVNTGPLENIEFWNPGDKQDECSQGDSPKKKDSSGSGNSDVLTLNCRVLLAEDTPFNQKLITTILKKVGAEVTVADNGKIAVDEALAARESGEPFDVILMDMQMPVLDGYGAAQQLRDAGVTTPIIAVTANAMTSDQQKCMDAGCNDYLTKPIDRKKMIEMVGEYAKASSTTYGVVTATGSEGDISDV